jgi:hypothetical protein
MTTLVAPEDLAHIFKFASEAINSSGPRYKPFYREQYVPYHYNKIKTRNMTLSF